MAAIGALLTISGVGGVMYVTTLGRIIGAADEVAPEA